MPSIEFAQVALLFKSTVILFLSPSLNTAIYFVICLTKMTTCK